MKAIISHEDVVRMLSSLDRFEPGRGLALAEQSSRGWRTAPDHEEASKQFQLGRAVRARRVDNWNEALENYAKRLGCVTEVDLIVTPGAFAFHPDEPEADDQHYLCLSGCLVIRTEESNTQLGPGESLTLPGGSEASISTYGQVAFLAFRCPDGYDDEGDVVQGLSWGVRSW
jgi:hypothetical protein